MRLASLSDKSAARSPKPKSLQPSSKPQAPLSTKLQSDTSQSQMCRIERFDVVYPNGTRERREQLNHCRRGTRSQPCRHVQVSNLEDRLASASDLRHEIQPHIVPIEPRDSESLRLRPSSRETPRGPIQGLTLNLKFWNPFSSKTKEKKEKTKYFFVRRTTKPEPRSPVIKHQSPIPPPPEPYFSTPVRGESPVVIPIQHPDYHTTHHLPEREPRRRRRRRRRRRLTPVVVHQSSEEDRDESASPPEANREHHRRTRSLSPLSRYEVEKEIIRLRELRQRELRQRERRDRITREEREARERAERVALLERLERQREREKQSERQERLRQERRESRERQHLAVEREARRQQEERDREEARRLQEQEDLERLRAADRARQLREERARRQQEEEDSERRRAAYHDRLRRLRDEQARRRYAEEQRNARARQANIPRPPRHPVFVHQNEGHLDRGERFIQDAIRAENLRQFERRAGWPGGGYDDGDNGLRRRNTIDGGQRWRRDRR